MKSSCMNPGFLFPDYEIIRWQRFIPKERVIDYRVICGCGYRPIYHENVPVSQKTVRPVVVSLKLLKNYSINETAEIYIGCCDNCKTGIWGAFEFHWLLWMNTQQHLMSILEAGKHLRYAEQDVDEVSSVITLLDTRTHVPRECASLVFHHGNLERIVYVKG